MIHRYVPSIGGIAVKAVRDLTTGYDSSQPGSQQFATVRNNVLMNLFRFFGSWFSPLTQISVCQQWQMVKQCFRQRV